MVLLMNEYDILVDGRTSQPRVVLCILSTADAQTLGNFSAVRYARHGTGFGMWWKQERKGPEFMTHWCHLWPLDNFSDTHAGNVFAIVTIYVRL